MDGNFFKRRRVEMEKTQRDIALALNMTTSAVSAWENDVSAPDRSIWPQVAAVYEVTVERIAKEISKLTTPEPAK